MGLMNTMDPYKLPYETESFLFKSNDLINS